MITRKKYNTLFLNEDQFKFQDDKFTIVEIFNGEYIFVKNDFVRFKQISTKTNKEYSSIILNREWTYNLYQTKDKVLVGEFTGQVIVDRFFKK